MYGPDDPYAQPYPGEAGRFQPTGHNPIDTSAFHSGPAAGAEQDGRGGKKSRRRARVEREPQGPGLPGPPPGLVDRGGYAPYVATAGGRSLPYVAWRVIRFAVLIALWLAMTLFSLALKPFVHIGARKPSGIW
jgi:hypothetical protein